MTGKPHPATPGYTEHLVLTGDRERREDWGREFGKKRRKRKEKARKRNTVMELSSRVRGSEVQNLH